jgi:hypothetical protein
VSSYEAQYAQLKRRRQMVPRVEAEYAQLNRDYEIQKKTYETLLARRQSATIGEGVQDAGGTHSRGDRPARVSPQPVPPTRVALLALAFAAALAAACRGLIASELMSTFHDARSLCAPQTKASDLGMVTMLPSEALSRMKPQRQLSLRRRSGQLARFLRRGLRVPPCCRPGRIGERKMSHIEQAAKRLEELRRGACRRAPTFPTEQAPRRAARALRRSGRRRPEAAVREAARIAGEAAGGAKPENVEPEFVRWSAPQVVRPRHHACRGAT